MNWRSEWKWLAALAGAFLVAFYLPVGVTRFDNAACLITVLHREHLAHAWNIEHATLEPEVKGSGLTTLIASRKTHPKEERQ
jgi:hypothetical protein